MLLARLGQLVLLALPVLLVPLVLPGLRATRALLARQALLASSVFLVLLALLVLSAPLVLLALTGLLG